MRVDLHIHSNYSDSSRSPEEIVSIAKNKGVGLISVCDHASIEVYDKLPDICKSNKINCILGVELSAMCENEDLHVLAYNFDKNNRDMKTLINKQFQDIECEYIVYNMSLDYPQMSLEDYRNYKYPKEKGGWKYIYYAVAKGAAATYEEAANFYAKYSTPNHLSGIGSCNMQDFCSTVKKAGGIPVLAHPGYPYERNPDNFTDLLKNVKEHGIEGIECHYPQHSKTVTDICIDFCKKNDMRITGGCDCHGDYDKSEGFTIGALDISIEMLDLRGIL
jgi:Predicted metal-dependent phosphoesterases (PHP family)